VTPTATMDSSQSLEIEESMMLSTSGYPMDSNGFLEGEEEEEEEMQGVAPMVTPSTPENAPLNMAERGEREVDEEPDIHGKDQDEEVLVPIRLEMTLDNQKRVQEIFTWNLKDKLMTPEHFAELLCIDLDLPLSSEHAISTSIHRQLNEYRKPHAVTQGERLVVVRLDLTVNNIVVRDQFQWDLNYTENSPETFARILCQDFGLSREYEVVVAHAIREQLNYLSHVYKHDQNTLSHPITAARAIRDEHDVATWSPHVSSNIQRANPQYLTQIHSSVGPTRHSTRLAANTSPYARPQ